MKVKPNRGFIHSIESVSGKGRRMKYRGFQKYHSAKLCNYTYVYPLSLPSCVMYMPPLTNVAHGYADCAEITSDFSNEALIKRL